MDITLHAFWRSSPSWRVRIALEWKGLAYAVSPVNLLAGEHRSPAHMALNPLGRVPVLVADGAVLTQGPAILEWIEEAAPTPPLLPADPLGRARVRAMCALVACDITPFQNLNVVAELRSRFSADDAAVSRWLVHFIGTGLKALDALAAEQGGQFCHGDQLSLADLYLVTQLFGARRFGVDLAPLSRLTAIEARCAALPAFQRAHPDRQPDAVK